MSIKVIYRQICQEDEVVLNTVEAAKEFAGLTEANQYLGQLCESVSGFAKQGNNVYSYKDFRINVGKRVFMAYHADGLRAVADLELSCLPELAAYIWMDNGEDMVLITRVKGSDGQRLVPCGTVNTLSETVRRRLLDDAERLMEKGYAVAALTGDSSAWYVLEDRSAVIFSRCELACVTDEAKPAYRRRVLDILGLN